MKKIYLVSILCGFSFLAKAQQGSVSTGGDASGTGGSASFSIGQVAYVSASDPNHSVSQGVQQPYEISVVTSVETNPATNITLNVYPNPTVSGVNLTISEKPGTMSFQLLDAQGKLIAQQSITALTTNISMDQLPAGTYLLNVSGNKTAKTFKIIKNK